MNTSKTVKGSVFSNEMQIIANANIEVIGEGRYSKSDENGKFSVIVNSDSSMLKFTHAGYDYDTISVADFINNLGYIQLYPNSLGDVVVVNDYKKNDNTLLWVFGVLAAISVVAVVATEVKIQKVKA